MTKVSTKLAGQSVPDKIAYHTVRTIVTVFCRVWCRMSIEGRDNIPTSGPFILAPTHRSIIDTPVASGVYRRRMRFMGVDGPAYVAMRTGVVIVPVGIGGSERVMPKGTKFIYPRKLSVIVGPPLRAPAAASPKEQRAATRLLTAELHTELQRLFDLAQARSK